MRVPDWTEIPALTVEQTAPLTSRQWVDLHADALALAPATGRHDARDSVRSAAVAGKLSHRTDRAARRGLRGRKASR